MSFKGLVFGQSNDPKIFHFVGYKTSKIKNLKFERLKTCSDFNDYMTNKAVPII